jgi:hypothetical protein
VILAVYEMLIISNSDHKVKRKSKVFPVTGRGGPQGCETSRLPHFLNNRLIDDGEVVSRTRRPSFNPRNLLLISVRG